MRIAIDAMGGDLAPEAPVLGALLYLRETHGGDDLYLIGDEDAIKKELSRHRNPYPDRLHVIHASEVITMHDAPATAVRQKKDSSMVKGIRLHRDGEVEAFVTAGNTGAHMAASLFILGRVKGVQRPGLGVFIPKQRGAVLLIDVGANAECKPLHLLQFALMGCIFMELVSTTVEAEKAQVGLLNIGSEPTKGNDLAIAAHELMKEHLENFVGNVEGRELLTGTADVVVTDGFTGNVVLKFAEGLASVFGDTLKKHIRQNIFSMFGGLLVSPAFKALKRKFDYEEYGGVPLLGIDGISIKCHGSSSSKAFINAIKVAKSMGEKQVNKHILEELSSRGLTWGEKQSLQA